MNREEIVLKVLSILRSTTTILNKNNTNSEEKSGVGNIVTETDKELEGFIIENLNQLFPFAYVIGEESAKEDESSDNYELKFIVDPLDGTTNFTNGWPHSIAIGVADSQELFGGLVYDVLEGNIYFSIKGKGVFYCDVGNISDIKRIKTPNYDADSIKKSVISFDTPYGKEAFKVTSEMINSLYHEGASLKIVGPISLDVLKTALGVENRPNDYNNAVWHSEVRAWDLAASTVILRELGGEIIGTDGKPLSYEVLTSPTERISFIACGNPIMLKKLSELYKNSYDKETTKENDNHDKTI